jgi:hypothetical protein
MLVSNGFICRRGAFLARHQANQVLTLAARISRLDPTVERTAPSCCAVAITSLGLKHKLNQETSKGLQRAEESTGSDCCSEKVSVSSRSLHQKVRLHWSRLCSTHLSRSGAILRRKAI